MSLRITRTGPKLVKEVTRHKRPGEGFSSAEAAFHSRPVTRPRDLECDVLIRWIALSCMLTFSSLCLAQIQPELQARDIVRRSEQTTNAGFERLPDLDYCMTESNGDGTHTYAVFMIDGSTYKQLVAVDGTALPAEEQLKRTLDREKEVRRRSLESPEERKKRVARYEKDQQRNHDLLREMGKAFNLILAGKTVMAGRDTYVLDATPRAGYEPKDRQTQVLTGMRGTIWIDTASYGWVRAKAVVVHPVGIEGFLARVEKGTQFELEERPFQNNIWLPTLFSVHATTRILFFFRRSMTQDYTFSHYVPRGTLKPETCLPRAAPAEDSAGEPRPER